MTLIQTMTLMLALLKKKLSVCFIILKFNFNAMFYITMFYNK